MCPVALGYLLMTFYNVNFNPQLVNFHVKEDDKTQSFLHQSNPLHTRTYGLSKWIVSIWSRPSFVYVQNNQVCISRLDVSWIPHPYSFLIISSFMAHRNIKLSIFKSELFNAFTNKHFAAVLIFVTNNIIYSLSKHKSNPEFCNFLGMQRIEN